MLVKFEQDKEVSPKQSEWFSQQLANGTIIDLIDSDFYK